MNPYPEKYFDQHKNPEPQAGSFSEQLSHEGFERVKTESLELLSKHIEILDSVLDGIKKGYPSEAFNIGTGHIKETFEQLSDKKQYLEETLQHFDVRTFKGEIEELIKVITDLFGLTMTMTKSNQAEKSYNEFESLIGALEKQREFLKEKTYPDSEPEFSEN
jgi:hypothetical protein